MKRILLFAVLFTASAFAPPATLFAGEPSYSRKENWGAGETFYQLVRKLGHHGRPGRR